MAVSTYNPNILLPEYYSSLVIYLSIATIPVGTVIAVYLGAMFLGNKLRILDKNTKRKFNIIKQFNKYGAFLCCSKEAYRFSIVYVAISLKYRNNNGLFKSSYYVSRSNILLLHYKRFTFICYEVYNNKK